MKPLTTPPRLGRKLQPSPEMEQSVADVEKIVRYEFTNKVLLEEALTHPSFAYSASYRRLAFLGDAVLGLAISKYLYCTYPNMDQGHFSQLRSANVSTDSFARVAVRHRLYLYLRHSSPQLDRQVAEFVKAGESGSVKPPKVLADIVESVAAAIYIDLDYDLDKLWKKFKHLLEPIVTHPVTMLYKLCQYRGKEVDIKVDTKNLSIASVYVDGKLVASNSSENMKIARLNAANQALSKLSETLGADDRSFEVVGPIGAIQKLNELVKKKWPKPVYDIEKESGPPHEKKFVCSVKIATLCMTGDEKLRKRDAENSAAWLMICGLEDESEDDFMFNNNQESDDDFMINNNNRVPVVYTVWRIISRGVMRLFVFCLKGVSLLIILSIVAKLLME